MSVCCVIVCNSWSGWRGGGGSTVYVVLVVVVVVVVSLASTKKFMIYKTCSHCKKELPISDFGTHKKTAPNGKKYDFRRHVCKPCYSLYETKRKGVYSGWSLEQKQAHSVHAELRRAKVDGLPKNFNSADWKTALAYFDNKCAYCGEGLTKLEQDHFVPVKMQGGYTRDNIVPACTSCNSKKRAKNPLDWLIMQPLGLVAYIRVKQYFENLPST